MTTSIPNPDEKFAVSLGALSEGRMFICGLSPRVLGHAVKIALRFSGQRKQFSKPGEKEEQFLIEYPLHQQRLFPYLASTFAMYSCTKWLFELWEDIQKDIFNPKNKLLAEGHAIFSALKATMTWRTMSGIQECRESCGGLGFSQFSKLGILRANWDVQ